MTGKDFRGAHDRGGFPGEVYSPDYSDDQPMSVMPSAEQQREELQTRHEQERRQTERPCQRDRMAVSGAVASSLLTSQDTSPVVFGGRQDDFSESAEMKWEYLYERYISDVIADTLIENQDLPNDKMDIAVAELPQHPQLREMYKKIFELRNKKDSESKEEFEIAMGEIKVILEWYSLTFNKSTLTRSIGLQAIAPIAAGLRESIAERGPDALREYDQQMAEAPSEEQKMEVLMEFRVREALAQQDPENLAQYDKEMEEATTPEQRKMILMKAAIRGELAKRNPEELAQFDKEMTKATTIEEQKAVLKSAVEKLDDPELKALFEEWEILEMAAQQKAAEEVQRKAVEEEGKKKAQEKPKEKPKATTVTGSPSVEYNGGGLSTYACEQARAAIKDSTYTLDDNGTLNLPRGLSVQVVEAGNGQYKLIDRKYASKEVGPFDLKDLAMKAYERFIDAYITLHIRPGLDSPDAISKVKDNALVTVGKALLGRGDTNGYKVMGDDLLVLDGLIDSLLIKEKGTTLVSRVNSLFEKLRYGMDGKTLAITGEAAAIRRKLLTGKAGGKKYSVSELLGEDKAEG